MDIKYFDRTSGNYNSELVYNVGSMKFLFDNFIGKKFTELFFSQPPFSQFYGSFKNTTRSAAEVPEFIKKYQIKMDEFEEEDFHCFNDFFIRKFKPNKRRFSQNSSILQAPCEGRYYAYRENNIQNKYPVKGQFISSRGLLKNQYWSNFFESGPVIICRLAPVDYHRFHYPIEGECIAEAEIPGRLYSVNPICLKNRGDVFLKNHRRISILKNEVFGHLAYIEVGAFCVGRIIQTHEDSRFNAGDEKGYFLFGGSTVILMGEKGRWSPDDDICEQTNKGFETFIQLGSQLGSIC